MLQKRFSWILVVLLILVVALAACSNNDPAPANNPNPPVEDTPEEDATADVPEAPSGEPVVIGFILPLSGGTAFDGQSAQIGAQAAAAYVNNNGGILGGRPIELVFEDSASDPAQAASAAEKLINNDNVVMLIGAFNSSSTNAVMPIAERYERPLVTGIATSAALTEQGNPWFFRAVGTSKYFVASFAKNVVEDLGATRIAYICENGDWGRSSVAAFAAAMAEQGGENLTEQVVNDTDADLYTQLTAIKNSNPDAIYAVSNLANAVRIAQTTRELGITVPIIGEGAWASSDFFAKAGDAAEGIYGMVEYLPEINTPLNPIFIAEYNKLVPDKKPDKYAACDFNTLLLAADAIDRAGSTEAAAIRDALAASQFEGLTGPLQFAENGQAYGFEMFLSLNKDGIATLAGSATVVVE